MPTPYKVDHVQAQNKNCDTPAFNLVPNVKESRAEKASGLLSQIEKGNGRWDNAWMRMVVIMQAVALCAATVFVGFPAASSSELAFSDYPAFEFLQTRPVHPDYTSAASLYRTEIKRSIAGGVNAGGHYVIVPLGCGGSCTVVEMVDLRNGRMVPFPIGGEAYYELSLNFRRDSRLIVADWKDIFNGENYRCIRRFYELRRGKVVLLQETQRPVRVNTLCSD